MGHEAAFTEGSYHHGARMRNEHDELLAYCRRHGWVDDANFRPDHLHCQ